MTNQIKETIAQYEEGLIRRHEMIHIIAHLIAIDHSQALQKLADIQTMVKPI